MNGYEFDRMETADGRLVYPFTTANSIFYSVEFKPSGYVFGEKIPWADACYEFSIRVRNETNRRVPYDARTALTISAVFREFFRQHERIIVYICETADGRHEARVKKFDRWFEQFDDGDFLKFDRILHDAKLDVDFFISLILRKNHPRRDEISTDFNQRMDEFSAEK